MNKIELQKKLSGKWLIEPKHMELIKLAIDELPVNISQNEDGETEEQNDATMYRAGNCIIIDICGVISQNVSDFEKEYLGMLDVEDIEASLEFAQNDVASQNIILNINSPGGTVGGVRDLHFYISLMTKPVYVFSNSMICSAAYWIASAASGGIYCSSTTDVGNIGCYIFGYSIGNLMEKNDYAPYLIKSKGSKFKAMGIMPLSDDEKEVLQNEVDEIYNEFKGDVQSARRVSDDACNGLSYSGEKAISLNLMDGIVKKIDDLIKFLNEKDEQ